MAALVWSGSSIERGTEPRAAWCRIASTPAAAVSQSSREATLPSTKWKRAKRAAPTASRTWSRLVLWPVAKLSRPLTVWSSSSSASSSEEPMKPATPVTSQRRGFALSSSRTWS